MESENCGADGLETSNADSMGLAEHEEGSQTCKDNDGVDDGEYDIEAAQTIELGVARESRN